MSVWKWEGVDRKGKKISGNDSASDESNLKKKLRIRGVRVTKVVPPSLLDLDLGLWLVEKGVVKPFTNKELSEFTRQLATMISAGVPILQSLEIMYKQEKNIALKESIKLVASRVAAGKSMSDALKNLKGFDDLYCNLVAAGEAGGVLEGILDKIATYLEKQEKITAQIKSALTYPSIVMVVGVVVVTGMLYFVVPKFVEMLTQSGQEIPEITQFVIDASDFLKIYIVHIFVGIFVSGGFLSFWKNTPEGKPVWEKFTMGTPLFGAIVIKGNLSSFTRTLSTMLVSGISLVDSLEICYKTMGNAVIAKDIKEIKKQVEEGKTLTQPLGKIPYFPEMVVQMVRVGEQTGKLDTMLERVANIFEKDVESTISAVTKLIEPFILIFLGGFIAVILLAMYMPIFKSAGGTGE